MAKILIVEDERSIRQALRFELEDQGYEVGDAADYSEAVSAMRAFDYDLVISDIYLNNGDGVQLIRTTYNEKKDVPFIGMTAFPSSDLAQKAKLILKDRFFEKPFLAKAIKEKVNEVLSVSTSEFRTKTFIYSANFYPNELANRILKSANHWSVVKSNN